jgi:hypothetical protein
LFLIDQSWPLGGNFNPHTLTNTGTVLPIYTNLLMGKHNNDQRSVKSVEIRGRWKIYSKTVLCALFQVLRKCTVRTDEYEICTTVSMLNVHVHSGKLTVNV